MSVKETQLVYDLLEFISIYYNRNPLEIQLRIIYFNSLFTNILYSKQYHPQGSSMTNIPFYLGFL